MLDIRHKMLDGHMMFHKTRHGTCHYTLKMLHKTRHGTSHYTLDIILDTGSLTQDAGHNTLDKRRLTQVVSQDKTWDIPLDIILDTR